MSRAATYVYSRPSGYYFCLNVPSQIRKIVKAKQIRHPPATQSSSVAKYGASFLAYRFRGLFNLLRSGAMSNLSQIDVKALVRGLLLESLAASEQMRLEISPHTEEGRQEVLRELRVWERRYREAAKWADCAKSVNDRSLTYNPNDPSNRKACVVFASPTGIARMVD